jgi:hypothetical protein
VDIPHLGCAINEHEGPALCGFVLATDFPIRVSHSGHISNSIQESLRLQQFENQSLDVMLIFRSCVGMARLLQLQQSGLDASLGHDND